MTGLGLDPAHAGGEIGAAQAWRSGHAPLARPGPGYASPSTRIDLTAAARRALRRQARADRIAAAARERDK
jgi:hypothetical protein